MKLKQVHKNGSVVRSKGVAVHAAGRRAVLDPAVSVPVLTAGRFGKLRFVPRADFLPASVPKSLVGAVALGDTLVDIFTPRYGSWYPAAVPLFDFRFSRCEVTHAIGWYLSRRTGEGLEPSLRFGIRPEAQAAYMRVEFGQNADNLSPRSILKVRIDGQSFHADIAARSFGFLDVVLPGDGAAGHEVEFSLDAVPPGQSRVLAVIYRVELYRSIRAFPTDVFGS